MCRQEGRAAVRCQEAARGGAEDRRGAEAPGRLHVSGRFDVAHRGVEVTRLLAKEAGRLCVAEMPYKAAGWVAEEARRLYVAELARRHFVAEQLCMTG